MKTLSLFLMTTVLVASLLIIGHKYQAAENEFDYRNPLIPLSEIRSGGPPKDGIPSLTDPHFVPAEMAKYLKPDDRVLGVGLNGVAKAYPLKILTWHEAVNDLVGELPILATY